MRWDDEEVKVWDGVHLMKGFCFDSILKKLCVWPSKQVGAEGTTGEVESAVEPGLCRLHQTLCTHVEGVG